MYKREIKLIPDKDISFNCEEFEIDKRRLFRYIGKSTVVTIPNGITEIGANSFYGHSEIVEIILPETVVTIGAQAFAECRNLRKINLPEGLKVIDRYAFLGCMNLESVTFPDYDRLRINPTAFNKCNKLCIYAHFSVKNCIAAEHPNRIAFAAGFLKMLQNGIEPSDGQRILSLFLISRYGSSDVSEKNLGADTLKDAFRKVILEKGLSNRYDILHAMLEDCFARDAEVMTKLIEQKRRLALSSEQEDLTLE